ncbi:hypothetical protein J7384_01170 [Endozoicomonas sp. G2_1]|nr:hypothetical protein [Endozoicomonas sp. G2_1]
MHWQQLMKQGNDCFDQQQWLQAEYFYQEAITSLDSLWQQDIENIELLMAWISGVHNLSALFEVQEESQVALQFLLIAHQRMLDLSQNQTLSEDMQLIAHRALKTTLMPLLQYSQKYPTCNHCQHALQTLKAQLDQNQETVH